MVSGPWTGVLTICGAGAEKGAWVGGWWWAAGQHRLGFGNYNILGRLQITAPISHWICDQNGTAPRHRSRRTKRYIGGAYRCTIGAPVPRWKWRLKIPTHFIFCSFVAENSVNVKCGTKWSKQIVNFGLLSAEQWTASDRVTSLLISGTDLEGFWLPVPH